MRYAVIDKNSIVINIIEWDGISTYYVDPENTLIHIDIQPWNVIGNIYTNIDPSV